MELAPEVHDEMGDSRETFVVGVTAGSAFDLDIETAVFVGMDLTLRPVDVERPDDLVTELADVDAVIDRLLAAPYTASTRSPQSGPPNGVSMSSTFPPTARARSPTIASCCCSRSSETSPRTTAPCGTACGHRT
jgi:hypothetical protein